MADSSRASPDVHPNIPISEKQRVLSTLDVHRAAARYHKRKQTKELDDYFVSNS